MCSSDLLSGSNPGVVRGGAGPIGLGLAGGGTSFFIFQGTSFLPWVRLAGNDVLRPSSGSALSVGKGYAVAFSAKSQTVAKCAWNGAVKHSATHSTAFSNFVYSYVGAQYLADERVGNIALFVQFDRLFSDAELTSLTANPWQIFAPVSRPIYIPVTSTTDPRYARPNSDTSVGAWLPSSGTELFAMVDEATASDADYIYATTATI